MPVSKFTTTKLLVSIAEIMKCKKNRLNLINSSNVFDGNF